MRSVASASRKSKVNEGGNTPYVIVPKGCEVRSLENLVQNDRSKRPHRIKQTVEVWDAESFIAYFLNFRDACSRVSVRAEIAADIDGQIIGYSDSSVESDHP